MSEFLKQLKAVYKKDEGRDAFGRRKARKIDFGVRDATSKEIYDAIHRPSRGSFHNLIEVYLPTEKDLKVKEEGLRRRRHVRKPR